MVRARCDDGRWWRAAAVLGSSPCRCASRRTWRRCPSITSAHNPCAVWCDTRSAADGQYQLGSFEKFPSIEALVAHYGCGAAARGAVTHASQQVCVSVLQQGLGPAQDTDWPLPLAALQERRYERGVANVQRRVPPEVAEVEHLDDIITDTDCAIAPGPGPACTRAGRRPGRRARAGRCG